MPRLDSAAMLQDTEKTGRNADHYFHSPFGPAFSGSVPTTCCSEEQMRFGCRGAPRAYGKSGIDSSGFFSANGQSRANCVLQLDTLSFIFGLLNTGAESELLGNVDGSQSAGIGGP